jgi:hypothetical protein
MTSSGAVRIGIAEVSTRDLAARQIRSQPTVGLSLPDPLTQRLVPDPQIAGDLRDRPP